MSREDPFMDESICVERLAKEWRKHGQLIVAVDFDDTIFGFHNPTDTHPRVLALLKEVSDMGCLIAIYTASTPERWPMMRAFVEEHGIKVASINENPIKLPYGVWGKIYYNVFLDERAGLPSAYRVLKAAAAEIKKDQKTS